VKKRGVGGARGKREGERGKGLKHERREGERALSLSLHFSLEDFSRAAESFLVSIYSVAPPPFILAPLLCVEKGERRFEEKRKQNNEQRRKQKQRRLEKTKTKET
jgi:hypothetical protein